MIAKEIDGRWTIQTGPELVRHQAFPRRLNWLRVPADRSDLGAQLSQLLSTLTATPCPGKGGGRWGGRSGRFCVQGRLPAEVRGGGGGGTPTGLGAEAILLVAVIVFRGPTPAVAVRAALRGTAVVGGALEAERELAGLSVSVATHGEQGWGRGREGRV